MAVLLLNGDWQPLRVITTKRAVVLLLSEKAEPISESELEFRSVNSSVKVPDVIRLRKFVQVPYRARIPLSNAAVLARDGRVCVYCKVRKATTVDHVIPKSRGGRHEWENVVAACRPCNAKKAHHLLSELGWELPFTPYIPSGYRWMLLGIPEVQPAWQPYLVGG